MKMANYLKKNEKVGKNNNNNLSTSRTAERHNMLAVKKNLIHFLPLSSIFQALSEGFGHLHITLVLLCITDLV